MTERKFSEPLPIDVVLDDVRAALRSSGAAVLVAAPGAGKTTRVPLALLDEPWRNGKILVLEPRRIAAGPPPSVWPPTSAVASERT